MPLETPQVTVDDFIAARWFYPGRQRKVRLGVLHATQSPERKRAARGVANDFASRPASNKASAHVVVDDAETIGCVKPGDTAFAVPSANADGFHIEQVGYSEQQLLDWQDDYSQKVIARAAACAREASAVFDLPKVWLSVDDVRNGHRGWTDHATCSKALGGTHWDPGPDYPRDQFMQLLTGGVPDPPPVPAPVQEDDDMKIIIRPDGNAFLFAFGKLSVLDKEGVMHFKAAGVEIVDQLGDKSWSGLVKAHGQPVAG